MKAARLYDYGQPLVIEEVPTPEIGAGEVLVKIEGAGFCHSDIHLIDGEIKILPKFPHILGHENAGVVAQVGRGVTAVKEGDPVVVYGGWGCGFCRLCVTGHEQLCLKPRWVGISEYDGGYAEYLRVPSERYLVKLSRLQPREAAPLADAALTPYRGIKRALPYLTPDGWALVIGIGGLGLFAVKLLRALSGVRIIAVDIDDSRLELARQNGAELTFNLRQHPDLAQKLLDLTHGEGVLASFDFVGNDETLALCIGTTTSGGKVTQLGLMGGTARLKVLENSRFEVLFEATLWGNIQELREVVALVESGKVSMIPVHFFPLDAINEVYTQLKAGKISGRAVITP
ncbi:MAG: NAD(P)-dependent alcohol dehydrogenase [Armatimonadota bacterium]